ncbi:hypothetical protein PHLGIDRAFT_406713 [Phlebiopsis gigantea 11061_1 CR5-6]|uniref:Uncharacterized protein n=1 Tax=Phlebiopsis gigantea (strain 11061_1 CR5-6) TaxID=745531 RepID=A0A0C3PMG8_PHLG1|nr:hypothetical protein PHLGIDRAFT_406713 [Phlebiopsis gigantea 11061_1 CR5-6]
MPPSTRYSRGSSPSRSNSNATSSGQQRANIVKRLAIEGRAERTTEGKVDGASIRMFLRTCLQLKLGEGTLKVMNHQVHPLDKDGAPYSYSSTTSPLLKKVPRILGLPTRNKESYMSLFGIPSSPSSGSSSAPPVEDRYAGRIAVTQYQVGYILPKEFPSRSRSYDDSSYGRRTSVPEYHFVAVIDLWVPFMTRPPSYPYLLSIPVPRCLSNQLRLKIFPPPSAMASSLASLSSTEGETWDILSDPPVTRHKRSRSRNSHFADDESSDSSSSGYGDGYVIQGSFPSTDCMRVRWATPMKTGDIKETSDGRRRVGIRDVEGAMTCMVLERNPGKGKARGRAGGEDSEGIVMRLEYTGTCKGIWFPGVATMLGMDVSLDAGDCEVVWAPGEEPKWTVNGAAGFTGFAVAAPSGTTPKKTNPPQLFGSPSTPNGRMINKAAEDSGRWPSSSASLLRAPLPAVNTDDSLSETGDLENNTPLSSIASSATIPSSPERRSRASSVGAHVDSDAENESRPPQVPLSIHLNMNELVPPQKSSFTFSITGSVLVTPPRKPFQLSSHRSTPAYSGSDSDSEVEPVILPQFRVLFAEKETVTTTVRNELDEASLDIYNSKGDISDPQSRKTVVQPGGRTQCGVDGGRVAVRSITSPAYSNRTRRAPSADTSGRRTPSRPRTPNGYLHRTLSATSLRQSFLQTPRRRADILAIADVTATVRLSPAKGAKRPVGYDVELSLPNPADTGSEWLEFFLRRAPAEKPRGSQPQIQVRSAFVDKVPVRFESSVLEDTADKQAALGFPLNDDAVPPEPTTCVRVQAGEEGGTVDIIYSVSFEEKDPESELDVLLPVFLYSVTKMVVEIPSHKGILMETETNLTEEEVQEGIRLVRLNLEEHFQPELSLGVIPIPSSKSASRTRGIASVTCMCGYLYTLMMTCASIFFLTSYLATSARLDAKEQALAQYSSLSLLPTEVPEPATITTTIYATTTATATTTVTLQPSAPSASSTRTPAEPVHSPSPATSKALPTLTPTVPASSPTSTDALLSIRDLPFLWPLHFDIPPLEIPETARATALAVWRGLGRAWEICRKVYHYPLDPP